jgi:hypothetical protein
MKTYRLILISFICVYPTYMLYHVAQVKVTLYNKVAEDVLEAGTVAQLEMQERVTSNKSATPGCKNPILQLTKEMMTI